MAGASPLDGTGHDRDGPGHRDVGPIPVLLGYVAVFAALAWPLLPSLSNGLPTLPNLDDSRILTWVMAWVTHALGTDPPMLFDVNVAYPAPKQLASVPHFLSMQLVIAPIRLLGGNPILAANGATLLSYPLAAFAMQRLLRALSFPTGVSLVCGFSFALGSLRVPFNLNQLQYANLFLPWVALALTRLREDPSGRRVVGLLLAFGLGVFSSFYAAVLVGFTAAIWGIFELLRTSPKRLRFAVLSLLVAATVGLAAVVVLAPYLARIGDSQEPAQFLFPYQVAALIPQSLYALLTLSPRSIGITGRPDLLRLLLLGAAGAAFLSWTRGGATARRIVPVALILWLAAAILAWGYPQPLRSLAAVTPLGLVRYTQRYIVVADFGLTLLLAAALCAAGDWFGTRARRVAVVLLAIVVLVTRGAAFSTVPIRSIPAFSGERTVYDRVAQIWRAGGEGPLLELPIFGREPGVLAPRTLEPDAILASTLYWWPTPAAHVSYHAPHRWFFMNTVAALPAPWALQQLIDLTGVRWLLLRPVRFWESPERRAQVVALLRDADEVASQGQLPGGWDLIQIDRRSGHPAWLDAVRSGDVAGKTLLGTPLSPLDEADAIGRVHLDSEDTERVLRGRFASFWLEVYNAGSATWPVAVPSAIPLTLDGRWGMVRPFEGTVTIVAKWRRVDARGRPEDEVSETQRKRLRRDVDPGELLRQPIGLALPTKSGRSELEVSLEQVGGARFTHVGNRAARIRVSIEHHAKPAGAT